MRISRTHRLPRPPTCGDAVGAAKAIIRLVWAPLPTEIFMDHPDLPNPQPPSARRRLIRGVLSAPALMTVCSGSAFAQASNMRCLANAANATTPPADWGRTAPDTYLRVRLYKVKTRTCNNGNNNCDVDVNTFYIKGADLSMYQRSASMPTNIQYLQINPTTYVTIGGPVSPPPATSTANGRTTIIVSEDYVNQYVAVRFDSTGVIVGVGVPGSAGQGGMVGTSCWASFSPPGPLKP